MKYNPEQVILIHSEAYRGPCAAGNMWPSKLLYPKAHSWSKKAPPSLPQQGWEKPSITISEDIFSKMSWEGSYFDPSARDMPRKGSKQEGRIRIRKNPSAPLFPLPSLLVWCLPADKHNCISEHTQESMLVCPEDAKGHYTSPQSPPLNPRVH